MQLYQQQQILSSASSSSASVTASSSGQSSYFQFMPQQQQQQQQRFSTMGHHSLQGQYSSATHSQINTSTAPTYSSVSSSNISGSALHSTQSQVSVAGAMSIEQQQPFPQPTTDPSNNITVLAIPTIDRVEIYRLVRSFPGLLRCLFGPYASISPSSGQVLLLLDSPQTAFNIRNEFANSFAIIAVPMTTINPHWQSLYSHSISMDSAFQASLPDATTTIVSQDPTTLITFSRFLPITVPEIERLLSLFQGLESITLQGSQTEGGEVVVIAKFTDPAAAHNALSELSTLTNISIAHSVTSSSANQPGTPDSVIAASEIAPSDSASHISLEAADPPSLSSQQNHHQQTSSSSGNGGNLNSMRVRTIYVTSLGNKDKADIKAFCKTLPGFYRVQFGQTNFRVVLNDPDKALESMAIIQSTFKTMKATFARKEPEVKKIEELGEPSRVLWTSTLYWSETEFRKYLATYEGFEKLVFDAAHSWVHFRDVECATRALEDMNTTSNLYSVYSKKYDREGSTVPATPANAPTSVSLTVTTAPSSSSAATTTSASSSSAGATAPKSPPSSFGHMRITTTSTSNSQPSSLSSSSSSLAAQHSHAQRPSHIAIPTKSLSVGSSTAPGVISPLAATNSPALATPPLPGKPDTNSKSSATTATTNTSKNAPPPSSNNQTTNKTVRRANSHLGFGNILNSGTTSNSSGTLGMFDKPPLIVSGSSATHTYHHAQFSLDEFDKAGSGSGDADASDEHRYLGTLAENINGEASVDAGVDRAAGGQLSSSISSSSGRSGSGLDDHMWKDGDGMFPSLPSSASSRVLSSLSGPSPSSAASQTAPDVWSNPRFGSVASTSSNAWAASPLSANSPWSTNSTPWALRGNPTSAGSTCSSGGGSVGATTPGAADWSSFFASSDRTTKHLRSTTAATTSATMTSPLFNGLRRESSVDNFQMDSQGIRTDSKWLDDGDNRVGGGGDVTGMGMHDITGDHPTPTLPGSLVLSSMSRLHQRHTSAMASISVSASTVSATSSSAKPSNPTNSTTTTGATNSGFNLPLSDSAPTRVSALVTSPMITPNSADGGLGGPREEDAKQQQQRAAAEKFNPSVTAFVPSWLDGQHAGSLNDPSTTAAGLGFAPGPPPLPSLMGLPPPRMDHDWGLEHDQMAKRLEWTHAAAHGVLERARRISVMVDPGGDLGGGWAFPTEVETVFGEIDRLLHNVEGRLGASMFG